MVQTVGNIHLDLRYYPRVHMKIHFRPNLQDSLMHNPLITTILTQYHVYKGLKVFDESGVEAVLKELKQLHGRMVTKPKERG